LDTRAIQMHGVVDVTSGADARQIVRTTSNNVLFCGGTRATSANPVKGLLIWLRSIKTSYFGEADKRPGCEMREFASLFRGHLVVPVGANRNDGQEESGEMIRCFTSGSLNNAGLLHGEP